MWISCPVRSGAHTLSEDAFCLLQLSEASVQVRQVRPRDFVLCVRPLGVGEGELAQLHHAHHVVNAFLIALNAAALGQFHRAQDPWAHPVLTLADDLEGTNAREVALVVEGDTQHEELRHLTESDVQAALMIFGMVAREESRVLTGEYCRGLLLSRMNFYDLDFRREAFMCFYRAFENFVATRLLGNKDGKLGRNELLEIQRALRQGGADAALLEDFRKLYVVRSSQVAHSQGPQRAISFDEVAAMKVFLDVAVHRTFKAQAAEQRLERRAAG